MSKLDKFEDKFEEGPEPETGKCLAIETAYEQLAAWLGTTVEEIRTKFDIKNLVHNWGDLAGEPTHITVMAFDRKETGVAALCEVIDDKDRIIGTKIVGYVHDPGEVRIKNTHPRL